MDKSKEETNTEARPLLAAPLTATALEKTQIAKYHTMGGHGFAAEDANHFSDLAKGKHAEIVGLNNERNGADRVVNGLRIQSKYYQSASKTIAAAFDDVSGNYRYAQQVLEVPSDQYEACLEFMRNRITNGRVPGHENASDAEKLIKKGTVTFNQAKNIARFGNVDSLWFDAKNQSVTSTYVAALSFVTTFAQDRWRGECTKDATKTAILSSAFAGGTTLLTGVMSAQLLRTKAAAVGAVSVRKGVRVLSSTTAGRHAIHNLASGSMGKAIHGAAAINHVSKLLRTNTITSTVAVAAMSAPEFYRAAFEQSISWQQFSKNVSVNVVGVASGAVGWLGGAAVGAFVGSAVPVIGTAAGGIAGGILGALGFGTGGSIAAKHVADKFVDDDSTSMVAILQEEIQDLAFEYLLTGPEFEQIGKQVAPTATPKWLRTIFKQSSKGSNETTLRHLIREQFEPFFESVVQQRPKVLLPTPEELEAVALELFTSGEHFSECPTASVQ